MIPVTCITWGEVYFLHSPFLERHSFSPASLADSNLGDAYIFIAGAGRFLSFHLRRFDPPSLLLLLGVAFFLRAVFSSLYEQHLFPLSCFFSCSSVLRTTESSFDPSLAASVPCHPGLLLPGAGWDPDHRSSLSTKLDDTTKVLVGAPRWERLTLSRASSPWVVALSEIYVLVPVYYSLANCLL